MPLVIQADPLKVMADYLASAVPTVTDPAGFTFGGTDIKPGVTPSFRVMVRHVGGVTQGRTHDRPRVDVLVWADGTVKTQGAALKMARTLHGMVRRDLRCRDFASPVLLPDPADSSKKLALFTIELLTRGVQST